MLIIEGSDNLGKTTAALAMRKLVSHWNPPIMYCHMTRPNLQRFDFCYDYFPHIRKHAIQDRFHLGALAYQPSRITLANLMLVETALLDVHSRIVVFFTSDIDWYTAQLNSDTREQMYDIKTMLKVNAIYQQIAEGTHPLTPLVHESIDIKNGQYPNKETLDGIVLRWRQNFSFCG